MSLGGAIQRPANEVVDQALPWIEKAGGQPLLRLDAPLRCAHALPTRPSRSRRDTPGVPTTARSRSSTPRSGRVVDFLERQRAARANRSSSVHRRPRRKPRRARRGAHGFFIYESVDQRAVRHPRAVHRLAGRRVADPVRRVDLMPTVLDLLGVAAPPGISGVSLVPLMTGAERELGLDAYSEAMYPLHHYGWSELRALRSGRYKVIDAPRPELYDLDRDPARERTNLCGERQRARRSDDRRSCGRWRSSFGKTGARRCRAGRRRSRGARAARRARLRRIVRRDERQTRAATARIRRTRSRSSTS